MADSRIRRSNFNTRQSFSTRVTGPTMHAPRAGTAPLFADGTRFGPAHVAKGSSIKTRLRGFGGGEGTAALGSRKQNINLRQSYCWGGHHAD